MKFYSDKFTSPKVPTASLESLMERHILDDRDVDYLNHLEIEPVNIATEGILRAGAHDLGSVVTDGFRELKGWFIATETKRKYINEICEDLIDWLKEKDSDYRNLDLEMGTFKTFIKTSESFYWRFYFLLEDKIYNRIIADLKADRISELESIYDVDFSSRREVTRRLDSINNIKDLIKVVETYQERTNTFFDLILKRKTKIKSFPFQVILLGANDLRRTVKKIVNLAI